MYPYTSHSAYLNTIDKIYNPDTGFFLRRSSAGHLSFTGIHHQSRCPPTHTMRLF